MMALLLAALSFELAPDVVTTRDQKKFEGKVVEYDFFVDVEADPPPPVQPGKPPPGPTRIPRKNILRIDFSPNFIHCPETVLFPFNQLEKAEYTYFSCGPAILCLPQPPFNKVIAIDLRTGKKAWDLDLPDRVAEPVVAGHTVYFMQRDKQFDESKKLKFNGVASAKEIHRLTLTSVEIATGLVQWKQTFDNDPKDPKEQRKFWEYVAQFPPALYVLPDRLVIRTLKMSYPVDNQMNVDKNRGERRVSFQAFDPVGRKVLANTESDHKEKMGYPYFAEDIIVTQLYQGSAVWRLSGIDMATGRLRWQSDPFTHGQLFDVTEEYAYVADQTAVHPFSIKTGRKNDKLAVDCKEGTIWGIDLNYIYLYREKSEKPCGLFGFDPKKGTESWKINLADGDKYTYLLLAGHRLLYTDGQNTIICFDTLAKKEMWRWAGFPGGGFVTYPKVMGSALSFYKSGRVTQLDLETGKKIWDVKQSYQTVQQAGDAGLKVKALKVTEIIHERKLPKGAEFVTATGTPLKNAIGIPGVGTATVDAWSVPGYGADVLYSLSATGQFVAVDLKEKKVRWVENILPRDKQITLSPPIVHAKGIAVNVGNETISFDPDGKTKQWSVKHTLPRPDCQCETTPQGLLTVSDAGAALVDPATGNKVWETPLRGVTVHTVSGGRIFFMTHKDLYRLDPKTGAPSEPLPLPDRGMSLVAGDAKRTFAAAGPFALYEILSDDTRLLFKPKDQDQRVAIAKGFKGSVVAAEGAAFYSHADGEVARFESSEKPTWTFATPGFTSPLLAHGGRLWFAAWGKGLYGLNLKTGAVEWKTENLYDASLFTPFVRNGKAAFWSSDGWLIAAE